MAYHLSFLKVILNYKDKGLFEVPTFILLTKSTIFNEETMYSKEVLH